MKRMIAAALLSIAILTGCHSGTTHNKETTPNDSTKNVAVPTTSSDSLNMVAAYLINACATDFHDHLPSAVVGVRSVQLGHLSPASGKQYVLRGEFLQENKKNANEWVPFATVRTSGYEQYIGAQAKSYSYESGVQWDDVKNLSFMLKNTIDSLQKVRPAK